MNVGHSHAGCMDLPYKQTQLGSIPKCPTMMQRELTVCRPVDVYLCCVTRLVGARGPSVLFMR